MRSKYFCPADVPQLPPLDKENPYDDELEDDLGLSIDGDGIHGSSIRHEEHEDKDSRWHEEEQERRPGATLRKRRSASAPAEIGRAHV